MVFTAAWFALLALPVFVVVPRPKPGPRKARNLGFFGAYRKLWAEVAANGGATPTWSTT